jgi:hypothetical protein
MTHGRKPRRQRAPTDALRRLFARMTPMSEEYQASLTLPVRLAFQAFLDSSVQEVDFHTLAAAMNITLICAEKVDAMVEQSANAAVAAVQRIHDRHAATGQYGLDGPARNEIAAGIDIYEQLTSLLTGGQLHDAMAECYARMALQLKETAV